MSKNGSKGKCCGIGCLLLLLVLGGVGVGGYFFAKSKIEVLVTEFTGDKPDAIDAPEGTKEQVASAFTRFDSFRAALASGKPAEPLVLSDQDINLLMFHHTAFEAISGKTSVKIENDQMSAKVSMNLDEFAAKIPFPPFADMIKGRYFNGDAAVTISLQESKPTLFLEALTVNGMIVPPEVIKELRKQNFLEKAERDKDFMKLFEKIEQIKVEGNKLHIIPKK